MLTLFPPQALVRIRLLLLAATPFAPLALRAQAPTLNSTAEVTIGDLDAFSLQNLFTLRTIGDAPVAVTYAPDRGVIDVEMVDSSTNVDYAKRAVAKYWDYIRVAHIPYMQRRYAVTLTEQNYRIRYFGRTSTSLGKLVVTCTGGQYVVAP